MSVIINASTTTGLVKTADTSGTLELQSGGTTQLTVSSTGAYGQIKSGTAVASTSGTSIDFTGLPSWVKRITVMLKGVSTNGSSVLQIQIGSGSVTTTGYVSTSSVSATNSGQYLYATTGFVLESTGNAAASYNRNGVMQLFLLGSNTWAASGNIGGDSTVQLTNACAGSSPVLSGALDRVRITTVNGTDAFDAGSINILYEG
jgi:hypothetical protein